MANIESKNCSQCGAPLDATATVCKYCGADVVIQNQYAPPKAPQYAPQQQAPQYAPQQQAPQYASQQPPYMPQAPMYAPPQASPVYNTKSKTVAGILAILLGGIGIHKFYLGKIGMGILYILFCWTYIPAIIGLIEGIIYLCSSDENFYLKYVKK